MELGQLAAMVPLLFAVAALYASVGHGGASGYLAVLALLSFAPAEMATTALILNLLVAGPAFWQFRRAGHLRQRLLLAFLVSSVPAAFVGGLVRVPAEVYAWLLAGVLALTAIRLAWPRSPAEHVETTAPTLRVTLPAGAAIGLLSGVVGVGGGIFLSPVLLLMRWASAKETAAISAGFIFVNSLSGLGGRLAADNWALGGLLWLVPAAVIGGLVGSYVGAWRLSGPTLRRVLAAVLLIAAIKLAISGG